MLNFAFISLLFLFLIYQKLFLVNEEFLILICFITFCLLLTHRTKDSVNTDFLDRSNLIKNSISKSLNEIVLISEEIIFLHKKSQNVVSDLKSLKNHFLKLNLVVSNQLCQYSVQKKKSIYYKKLQFIQRLEQQSSKVLIFLLNQKIDKTVILKNFYTKTLKIPNFLCFDKIMLRECFEIV